MNLDMVINNFSDSLAKDAGSIFVGSGISAPSELPTWGNLLRPFAATLGIDINEYDHLPSIAQFIINANGNNRGPLMYEIKEKLTGNIPTNEYHRWLSRTNIKTIWTTNYDTLLEEAFRNYIKDVKVQDDDIARGVSSHEIEIIKAHGCIATSNLKDLVVSEEDYEDYFHNRPATAERLRSDLLRKSFLFIGYGYGDPNIRNIFVEARRLANKATRQHYMIQKAEIEASKSIRQKYWVEDIKRVGISCVLIDDYNELTCALERVAQKSRGRTLFATGGHELNIPNANEYGRSLASLQNLTLLDGQSEGVSRSIILSFTEECLRTRQDVRPRVRLFSNPYAQRPNFNNDPSLLPELKKWRAPLLREAQVMLVFPGGMGTKAEVEAAKMLGCYIIPVPLSQTDSAYILLNEEDIKSYLQARIPDYLAAAMSLSVTPEIVKNSVSEILGA